MIVSPATLTGTKTADLVSRGSLFEPDLLDSLVARPGPRDIRELFHDPVAQDRGELPDPEARLPLRQQVLNDVGLVLEFVAAQLCGLTEPLELAP